MRIAPFRVSLLHDDTPAVVALWNRAAAGAYGFFPLDERLFRRRIVQAARFDPARLLLAWEGTRLRGFLHCDVVREPYYEPAGVIEAVGVDPEMRGRGIGGALLDRALETLAATRPAVVDGGGAFPYCPFYATLVDGSERSGPRRDDEAFCRLFRSRGFVDHRESVVMENLLDALPEPDPGLAGARLTRERRGRRHSWLDFVFRGWTLWSYALADERGRSLSRAITGRMEGMSDRTGTERWALFGVNTPESLRGRGYATETLRRVLATLRGQGVRAVELHVYSDNEPALRLYRTLGFRELHRTVMFRRFSGAAG